MATKATAPNMEKRKVPLAIKVSPVVVDMVVNPAAAIKADKSASMAAIKVVTMPVVEAVPVAIDKVVATNTMRAKVDTRSQALAIPERILNSKPQEASRESLPAHTVAIMKRTSMESQKVLEVAKLAALSQDIQSSF